MNFVYDNRHRSSAPPRRRRPAFSFTEVLFAVMVLGLGFIMIAAMFPVTIGQTQITVQETAAAGVARAAFEALSRCPNLDQLEETDTGNKPLAECPLLPIAQAAPSPTKTQKVWESLAGNFINSQDPRYAWSVLYRRAKNDSVAQVITIVTQNRTRGEYRFNGDLLKRGPNASVLEPKLINVTELDKRDDGTEIYIAQQNNPTDDIAIEGVVAEGAYVVIGDASHSDAPTGVPATMSGRIFQLGPRVNKNVGANTPLVFKVQPGTDLGSAENGFAFQGGKYLKAYVVGRSYKDDFVAPAANNPALPADFEGQAQDIGVYTGFISIP